MKTSTVFIVLVSSLFLFACTNTTQTKYADLNKPPEQDTIKDLNKNININNSQKPTTPPTTAPSNAQPLLINPNIKMQNPNQPTNQSTSALIKTSKGDITIKLYDQETPNTVANFQSKIASSFYKDLTFHRVVPDFVIQGGDPLGNGTGGGNIASEITKRPFVRGTVGLARGGDIKVSNDSQFFICLSTQTCAQLTNQYVNFGEVTQGMEVVDQIAVGDKIISIQ